LRREVTTDVAVLQRLIATTGKDVIDIGCGGGALVRELARRGARVVGIEISAEQLSAALSLADHGNGGTGTGTSTGSERYLVGRAQALPLEDGSVDVAVFMRTLHHVPPPDLEGALRETRRVLRPGGVAYVAEPLSEGDYYALASMVEDELEARQAAQVALIDAALAGLELTATVEYDVQVRIADLAALRKRMVSVNPHRAEIFDAREAAIAAALGRLGEPGERPGERRFLAPMRADVLRVAAT
jgi:SAM-dependent methyltransferase